MLEFLIFFIGCFLGALGMALVAGAKQDREYRRETNIPLSYAWCITYANEEHIREIIMEYDVPVSAFLAYIDGAQEWSKSNTALINAMPISKEQLKAHAKKRNREGEGK